jgi:TonB family protein
MKTRSFLFLLVLLGAAASASAVTSVEPPRPVKVTSPQQIPREFEGATFHVEMTIDAHGRPSDIRVTRPADARTGAKVAAAVAQWEFTAPQKAGQPTSMRVVLPVRLVDAK